MARKKKAAPSVETTQSGKGNITELSIPQAGQEVNSEAAPFSGAASWREEAAQHEMSENAKKAGELKRGLLEELPAECRGIVYPKITGIIYRRHPHGGVRIQVELLDACGHSRTIAAPKEVHILDRHDESEAADAKNAGSE